MLPYRTTTKWTWSDFIIKSQFYLVSNLMTEYISARRRQVFKVGNSQRYQLSCLPGLANNKAETRETVEVATDAPLPGGYFMGNNNNRATTGLRAVSGILMNVHEEPSESIPKLKSIVPPLSSDHQFHPMWVIAVCHHMIIGRLTIWWNHPSLLHHNEINYSLHNNTLWWAQSDSW